MKTHYSLFILIWFMVQCAEPPAPATLENYRKLATDCQAEGWKYTGSNSELAMELKYTSEICEKYKLCLPTMLAIRYVESTGQKTVKAGDYRKTGSLGTYQQTRKNTKDYGKGKTHKEVSTDVYLNIETACLFMRDCKNKLDGYNRQVVAFNTGITGAEKLTYNQILESKYLALVLVHKRTMERILKLNGISYEIY